MRKVIQMSGYGNRGKTPHERVSGNDSAPRDYHHGSLPQALLEAAETVLQRDGLAGLSLRAIAREAGVSHTAPQHHFGDMKGVLSELAALGNVRLVASMADHAAAAPSRRTRQKAIGRGYVAFAVGNPDLFRLMGRHELLDAQRPSLMNARRAAIRGLAGVFDFDQTEKDEIDEGTGMFGAVTAAQLVKMTGAWASVHGLASLLIDNRLNGLIALSDEFRSAEDLVDAVFDQL
ncbi:MAG: TetR/AcrR family transcriptional regulator [Janthinobacterium lividum]